MSFIVAIGLFQADRKESKYQGLLKKYVRKGLPGLIVLIQDKNNMIIADYGYSNIETRTPISSSNIFYSASIGKTYCATAIMLLEQEGKLNISDKIMNYLPENIWGKLQNGSEITIKHLLNHTSGIPNIDFNRNFLSYVLNNPFNYKRSDVLRFIIEDTTKQTFLKYSYSSSNYELLTLIIDSLAKDHADIYTKNIIQNINLNHTYYKNEKGYPTPPNLVECYTENYNNDQLVNISSINNYLTSILTGSDGILASIQDYYFFFNSLLTGKIVNETELNRMQDWIPINSNKFCGLGLLKMNTKHGYCIGNEGDAFGEALDIWYFPSSEVTIVAATNVGTGMLNSSLSRLYNEHFIPDLMNMVFQQEN